MISNADPVNPNRPLLIAHKGASGRRPEHTVSAYRQAFLAGADAVEPDIVLTRDGVFVIRHENEISTTTDIADRPEFASRRANKIVDGVSHEGWFSEDFTWGELEALRCRENLPEIRPRNTEFDLDDGILRLADLLELVVKEADESTRVVIEIKHANYFEELGFDVAGILMRELDGWRDELSGRIIIESFELGVLEKLRGMGASAQLIFLIESSGAPADEIAFGGESARDYGWFKSDEGLEYLGERVAGISLSKIDLFELEAGGLRQSDIVARAKRRGMQVYTWTHRPENFFLAEPFRSSGADSEWGDWTGELEAIAATGVDAIFVDYPDLAAKHFRGAVSGSV